MFFSNVIFTSPYGAMVPIANVPFYFQNNDDNFMSHFFFQVAGVKVTMCIDKIIKMCRLRSQLVPCIGDYRRH